MSRCPYSYPGPCSSCRNLLHCEPGCVLRFVDEHPEGASLPEIAEVLGLSWQAVQQTETKALSKLTRRGAFLFRGHR
jgi:hypothetical protein